MLYLSSSEDIEDAYLAGYAGPGWYYWDETEANLIGPFKTESEAAIDMKRYVEHLNTERSND